MTQSKFVVIIVCIVLLLSGAVMIWQKNNIYKTPVWLGVQVITVDSKVAKNFNLHCRRGILVRRVIDSSPAEKAGLEQGDVIRRIGHTRVVNTFQFKKMIDKILPGQKKRIVIRRNRVKKTLYAKLEPRPFIITDSNAELVSGFVPVASPPVNKPYPYFYFGEEREERENEPFENE